MKGLWLHPKTGKAYHRTRRGGKTRLTPLPDLPQDHPDFIAAWIEASRNHPVTERPKAGTLGSTWAAMRVSDQCKLWTPLYLARVAKQMDQVCTTKGHVAARVIRAEHITKDVADADNPPDRLRAWRAWGAWSAERGVIGSNPAALVKAPREAKPKGKIGHRRWTVAEIETFRARWSTGTVPRAMMELLLWTGARVSDAVAIGPQMIDAGGVLVFRQRKTKELAYVPWSCTMPPFAREADRQMMLAAIAPFTGQLCFLPTHTGRPRSDKGTVTMMLKACKTAGIDVSAHGLRKARSAMIVENGGTSSQSAAWTGHQSIKLAEHYQRETDRRMAVVGIAGSGTDTKQQLETHALPSGNLGT